MATDTNIQMNHFNGTDWDKLYPKTKASIVVTADGTTDVDTALGNKVDVVAGKQLSTNDFTNAEKTKLDNFNGVSVSVGGTTPTDNSQIWFQTL